MGSLTRNLQARRRCILLQNCVIYLQLYDVVNFTYSCKYKLKVRNNLLRLHGVFLDQQVEYLIVILQKYVMNYGIVWDRGGGVEETDVGISKK